MVNSIDNFNSFEKIIHHRLKKLGVELWCWKYLKKDIIRLEDRAVDFLTKTEQLRLSSMVGRRRSDYLAGRWMWYVIRKNVQKEKHSISHSNGVVALGLASTYLGIDIEVRKQDSPTNRKKMNKVVSRFFSNNEEKEYLKEKPLLKQDYFLKTWTTKEACYKLLSQSNIKNSKVEKQSFFRLLRENVRQLITDKNIKHVCFDNIKFNLVITVAVLKSND